MSNSLRVSLVQRDLVWEDKAANLARFEQAITPLAGQTDLVLLPEMFTTGFSMEAASLAEPMDGPTLQWLRHWSAELGAVLAGSVIISEAGRYYNRLLWVTPDGEVSRYDKRHCFTLAGEDRVYTAGRERVLLEWRGWRIFPLICYDLRFPVWSRNDLDYHLLLYVASFPERRAHAWRSLLPARAIENQCYVAAVNRVGRDGLDIGYSGDSAIYDMEGKPLVTLGDREAVITLTLDLQALLKFRESYAFLADRDAFHL